MCSWILDAGCLMLVVASEDPVFSGDKNLATLVQSIIS